MISVPATTKKRDNKCFSYFCFDGLLSRLYIQTLLFLYKTGMGLSGSGAFTDLTLRSLGDGFTGTEFTLDGLGHVLGKVLEVRVLVRV